MKDRLLSTASSYSWSQKGKETSVDFPFKMSKEEESLGHDLYRKYSQFMGAQNVIVTEVLLDNKVKGIQQGRAEQQIVNRLRDSSNEFIKNLLQELTEVYSKLRSLKSTSEERIKLLESELVQERSASKLLTNKFYSQWQQNSEKCQKYINFVQEELKETIQQYESKVSEFLKEIEKKDQYSDRLYCQKLQLTNQVSQLNRVLRMERQNVNQKCKQFKGMEMLIGEYQIAISEYENQKAEQERIINELRTQVKQLEDYNKELVGQLNQLDARVGEKEQEIGRLNRIIDESRSMNVRYLEELQNQKQKFSQDRNVLENNFVLLKNNQKSLKLEMEQVLAKLVGSQKNLAQTKEKLIQSTNEGKKSKLQAKTAIAKVQLMFKTKQKLIKKAFKSKLGHLRAKNEELKESISKEIFKFYQQMKIDLITYNIPESKSSVYSSRVARARA